VSALLLRNLEPPERLIQAINAGVAQQRQSEAERRRVGVARPHSEQQRPPNQTVTTQVTTQHPEVPHDVRNSNKPMILVPTGGGVPILDVSSVRSSLRGR
jgi:hypothetical protein